MVGGGGGGGAGAGARAAAEEFYVFWQNKYNNDEKKQHQSKHSLTQKKDKTNEGEGVKMVNDRHFSTLFLHWPLTMCPTYDVTFVIFFSKIYPLNNGKKPFWNFRTCLSYEIINQLIINIFIYFLFVRDMTTQNPF